MLGNALRRAHSHDQRAKLPWRARNSRYLARKARAFADELRERIAIMRHEEEATDEGPATWPWRVMKGSLRFGDVVLHRGQEVPQELLDACANRDVLIRSRYIARGLAAPSKAPRPAPQAPVASAPSLDPVEICRREVRRIAAEKNRAPADCVDLVDSDVMARAIKHYGDMPRTAMYGAWGSGGGRLTTTGIGSNRRLTDGFTSFLLHGDGVLQSQEVA